MRALEKPHPAAVVIRKIAFGELDFERLGVMRRAEKHGHLGERHAFELEIKNTIGNKLGLFRRVGKGVRFRPHTSAENAFQIFSVLILIIRDHFVRHR